MTASNAWPIAKGRRPGGSPGRAALTGRQADAFVLLGLLALNWPLLALLRPGKALEDLLVPGLILAAATALSILKIASGIVWPAKHRYGSALFAAGVLSILSVSASVIVERSLADLVDRGSAEWASDLGEPDWNRSGWWDSVRLGVAALQARGWTVCAAPIAGHSEVSEIWYVERHAGVGISSEPACHEVRPVRSDGLRLLRADEIGNDVVMALRDARHRHALDSGRPVTFVTRREIAVSSGKLCVALGAIAVFNVLFLALVGAGRKTREPGTQ